MGEAERTAARARAMGSLRDALAVVMGADRRRRNRPVPSDTLSQTHLRAMWLLLREGEATAGDLARVAHLNPASVTAMIDQLQGRGLVERRRHAADRRVCLVALTSPGHALVAAQEQRTAARLEGLLDGISDEELVAAARVLGRLAGLLDDGVGPLPAAVDVGDGPRRAAGARPPVSGATLAGFTVGVTADRRGDDQAVLLSRLGVEVVRGPVLRTELGPVDDDLRAATVALIASPPDVLVANTGFGIRSWWTRAATWGLDADLTAALAGTCLAARGPKAAGALRSLGLPVWWRAPTEQLSSVVDHLVAVGVDGLTVAVQRHGDDDDSVARRLRAAGARVHEVPVYRWARPADETAALALIRRCCEGTVDAVTFTAGPAVRQFVDLAEAAGLDGELLAALNERMVVVCVGPVCAAVAREEGIAAPVVPEHWRLGAMVTLVGAELSRRVWEIPTPAGPLRLTGGRLQTPGPGPAGTGPHPDLAAHDPHRGPAPEGGRAGVTVPAPARRALALLIGRDGGPVPTVDLEALGAGPGQLLAALPALDGALVTADGTVRLAGEPAQAR